MTNIEQREYAATNRERLKKQKVALGDLVMILVGNFAGEKGVVKGISVRDDDFNDPYYEVDMQCEVPDKYKCRQTLLTPNNVIGGLSATDFEVICNRAVDSKPLPKIKVGDRMKTAEGMGTAKIVSDDGCYVVWLLDNGEWYVNLRHEKEEKQPAEDSKENEPKLSSEVDMVSEETANRLAEQIDMFRDSIGASTIPTPAWQSYRMVLAKAVAIAYAEKGRYEPSEIGAKAVEVANGVINKLKNSKI